MDRAEDEFLAERYGERRTANGRRNKILAFIALSLFTLSTLALGLANWSPIQSTAIGFKVVSPWLTEVEFELQMPPGSIAECDFEALDENFAQVGFVTANFGPFEQAITTHSVAINTYTVAVTGLVRECRLR